MVKLKKILKGWLQQKNNFKFRSENFRNRKKMEALKKIMLEVPKINHEDEKSSWFDCETCHILKKEVNTLKIKLDKALEPKVTFSIDLRKFKRYLKIP